MDSIINIKYLKLGDLRVNTGQGVIKFYISFGIGFSPFIKRFIFIPIIIIIFISSIIIFITSTVTVTSTAAATVTLIIITEIIILQFIIGSIVPNLFYEIGIIQIKLNNSFLIKPLNSLLNITNNESELTSINGTSLKVQGIIKIRDYYIKGYLSYIIGIK